MFSELSELSFASCASPTIGQTARVEPKTAGRLKCGSGATELGSCLTDATPEAAPGAPSSIRRYVRPERLALAIVAAFLTRWYHYKTSVADFANSRVVTPRICSPVH